MPHLQKNIDPCELLFSYLDLCFMSFLLIVIWWIDFELRVICARTDNLELEVSSLWVMWQSRFSRIYPLYGPMSEFTSSLTCVRFGRKERRKHYWNSVATILRERRMHRSFEEAYLLAPFPDSLSFHWSVYSKPWPTVSFPFS